MGTVTDPGKAVFLSYASQDAQAAQRLSNALRAAGIEVWFDQSELRGGDAWDQSIRKQIKTCALFLPIISKHTHERAEGYFRLEWKLAVDRSHLIAAHKAFLVPVVIDDTGEDEEHVPEKFREVQWTRLAAGATPAEFVTRIQRLLSGESGQALIAARRPGVAPRRPWRSGLWLAPVAVLAAVAVAYLLVEKSWTAKPPPPAKPATHDEAPTAFTPPPHSIAVLPFMNMSGDPSQEYFSDGLTEELLNSLSRINELRVAARTSAFSFKGKDADIDTIARKLNVAAVLEGSVRRSTHTVRITAQLIDTVTGFHMWSQTYDRNLGDVLALETEIATAVANALKVTLLEDTGKKIELGGTVIPAAFDAYLRGKKIGRTAVSEEDVQAAIGAYTEAIDLDPHFAMAFAERSLELSNYADFNARGPAVRTSHDKALADARTAVSLAPELAEGHYALGVGFGSGMLDFAQADREFERTLALAPGSGRMLSAYSRHAAELGHTAAAIAAARRAVILDPLNFHLHRTVGIVFVLARQYADAITAYRTAISLQPDWVRNYALLGQPQYLLGDFDAARASCEVALADEVGQACLAVVYMRLGRQADAEAMLQRLRSSLGDNGAYDFACIYAQWGEIPKALEWLETAMHLRDASLSELKAEPDLDPLRKEPRFQAIERALKFPN
ncbi:MAG TPA: TIR domain-containing protein [Steroidobacteraceae bacterium]|nr:TIR domain-containing protein [Steroidobacteraceae bacterium]